MWVIILPRFTRKTVIVKPGLVEIYSFPIRPQYSHVPRCEIEDLLEFHFMLSDLLFGALLFAQVEDEHDALVRTSKRRASNQHGHAAAVFPEILLLVCLKNPSCQELCQGTFVAIAPFGRRQIR